MEPATESGAPKLVSLKEITALLIKHYNYHEGLYEIAFGVQVSIGKIGVGFPASQGAAPLPGVSFGINGIGLAKTAVASPDAVDAAEVNPAK